ncbi:MAG: hypothetical protein NC453_29330 [Muribaculum sp.]|nr:hypothetical protein [Muribaculum sp.]
MNKNNQYKPNKISHPGHTLREKIKEMGFDICSFSNISGINEKSLKELIAGETDITVALANDIERITHIPTSFWLSRQKIYNDSLDNSAQYKSEQRGWEVKHPIAGLLKIKMPDLVSGVTPL